MRIHGKILPRLKCLPYLAMAHQWHVMNVISYDQIDCKHIAAQPSPYFALACLLFRSPNSLSDTVRRPAWQDDIFSLRLEKVQALRSFPDFPKFCEQANSTVNTAEDTTETAMSIVTCMVGSMWIVLCCRQL